MLPLLLATSSILTHCSARLHKTIHLLIGLSINYYTQVHLMFTYPHYFSRFIQKPCFVKMLFHFLMSSVVLLCYLSPLLGSHYRVSSSVLPVLKLSRYKRHIFMEYILGMFPRINPECYLIIQIFLKMCFFFSR